jgi:hypothetical protein
MTDRLAYGCCSAISPCAHQRAHPESICNVCAETAYYAKEAEAKIVRDAKRVLEARGYIINDPRS